MKLAVSRRSRKAIAESYTAKELKLLPPHLVSSAICYVKRVRAGRRRQHSDVT